MQGTVDVAILPLMLLLNFLIFQKFTYSFLFFQDRKLTDSWSKDQQSIVQQIREKWHQSQFSEEEIFRVEGILDVNTLELLDFDNEVESVI